MPEEDYYASKEWLDQLHYGECISNEVRRFYPCVPLMMARVRYTFEHDGLIFPKGWLVLLGVHGVHRDPRVYSTPGPPLGRIPINAPQLTSMVMKICFNQSGLSAASTNELSTLATQLCSKVDRTCIPTTNALGKRSPPS